MLKLVCPSLRPFASSLSPVLVFVSAVFTYMPQDFRGTLLKQQKDRSERRRQLEVDTLVSSGGSIKQKYALLWQQQMDRWV